MRVRFAISSRNVDESRPLVVAHRPPVVNCPLLAPTLRRRNLDRFSGRKVDRRGPVHFHNRLGREQLSGPGIEHVVETMLRDGHGYVMLLAVDREIGHDDVIIFRLQSR